MSITILPATMILLSTYAKENDRGGRVRGQLWAFKSNGDKKNDDPWLGFNFTDYVLHLEYLDRVPPYMKNLKTRIALEDQTIEGAIETAYKLFISAFEEYDDSYQNAT